MRVGPSAFGVPDADGDAVAGGSDEELETALGSRPVVVVTGERPAATSRSLHRAARRMLGDHRLLVPDDPHRADLPDVLAGARRSAARSGPVLVLVVDAGLGVLDQLPAAATALTPDRHDVRLVVTARPSRLDAFPSRSVRTALDAALVTVPAGPGDTDSPRDDLRRALTPSRAAVPVDLAVQRAAVDADRLGLPSPLSRADLVALARCHLADLGADPVPARELRRARPPVVDPALSTLADTGPTPLGWAMPPSIGRVLLERLGPAERGRVARVALARGDVAIALWTGVHLPPEEFSPRFALRMGEAVAAWSRRGGVTQGRYDHVADRWLAAARAGDDAGAAARAERVAEALGAAPARV